MKTLYITLAFLLGGIVLFAQETKTYTEPRKKIPAKIRPRFTDIQAAAATVAQGTASLPKFSAPDVIPPSPDMASLGKFGDIPVGLYSGIASVDVPLYEIRSKDIRVPVGISFHTGGVKVDEIASWVGLGASLNAGGSISRTVLGRADDKFGGYLSALYTPQQLDSIETYCDSETNAGINPVLGNCIRDKWAIFDAQNKYYDSQPDMFNYNFGGRSGKFFIDRANPSVGIPIPYAPIKISIFYSPATPPNPATKDSLVAQTNPLYGRMSSFTIDDENGVKYTFDEKETTQSRHYDPRQRTRYQYFYSAWHLTSIVSPSGGFVSFTYNNYVQRYRRWVTEDQKIRTNLSCKKVTDAQGFVEDNFVQRTKLETYISGKRIAEIRSENGKVVFTPSSGNRQDTNDSKLGSIVVYDADNNQLRYFLMHHSYFTEKSDQEYTFYNSDQDGGSSFYAQPNLGRLRLDSLNEVTFGSCLPPYRFSYYAGDLTHRYSSQTDHYGYYNGALSNITGSNQIPRGINLAVGTGIVGSTNRFPDINFAKIGTLSGIQYPTGGKTQLSHESHDTWASDWNLGANYIEVPPIDENPVAPIDNTVSTGSTITYANGSLNAAQTINITIPASGGYFRSVSHFDNSLIDSVKIYFYKLPIASPAVPYMSYPVEDDGYEFYLPAGTYRVAIRIADIGSGNVPLPNGAISVNLRRREFSVTNQNYNKLVGGLRIAQTKDLPLVGTPIIKNYVYRKANNAAQSSGFLIQKPQVFYTKRETKLDYVGGGVANVITGCVDLYGSATSVSPMATTKGAYVGYSFVEVFQENNGASGKTNHTFTTPIEYPDYVDETFYPFAPNTDFDWKRGFEKAVKHYKKKADGSYFILKSSTNFEVTDSTFTTKIGIMPVCDYVGIRYQSGSGGVSYVMGCTVPIFKNYQIQSGWLTNSKTVDTVYNSTEETGAFIVNTTNYFHKGRENLQMAKITQTSSVTGELREVTMSYPHDKKVTGNVYQQLVDAHIFTPVVEEIVRQSNVQIAKKTTNYLKWKPARTKSVNGVTINYPDFYAPQTQYWQQNGTDPNELQRTFLSYDDFGNLTSYQDRDGIRTDLDWFWYDGSSRPVTEKGKTHLLKSRTIGAGLSTAQTFEYDYLSGVGISKIKAPTGYFSYYSYDDLNRLISIKDHLNLELKHFDYHYRNCGAVGGLGLSLSDTMNYVVARTARTGSTSLNTTPEDVQTTIQYFDGLGRALQTIGYKASPDKTKDILLQTTQYDASGRANIGILPTPATGNLGKYDASALSLATAFYGDLYPFNETIFEASPLNRPIKNFGAGVAWRSNNKFVEHYYRIQGNEIRRFIIQNNGQIDASGSFEANSLVSEWSISERGINTIQLSDKLGRVVAKAQQLQGFDYLVTAYVYDDLDRLRYIIPPEIYKKMGTGSGQVTTFNENDNLFLEGMYGYHYDSKGRLIEKHIPGAGWTRSVYDKNYRVVLENDDKDGTNYWKFTKYDALNRPIITGLLSNFGSTTRQTLQTAFDNFAGQSYETISASGLLGYTNISFPTGSIYTVADADIRTVTYYDDYAIWQTDNLYNFKAANAYHTLGNTKGMVTGKLVRNLRTNTWQKMVLYYDYLGRVIQDFHLTNRNNLIRKDNQYRFNGELLSSRYVKTSGSNVISTKVNYYTYDHVGRRLKYLYSLNGNLKTIAKYQYDAIGRMTQKLYAPSDAIGSNQTGLWTNLSTWQGANIPTIADQVTINQGHTVTIPTGQTMQAGTLFNRGTLQNFGILQMGTLAGNSTGTLQTLDYKYHIRGGLKAINIDANNNLTNSLFSYKLDYEDDGTYFDGNIRKQTWKSNLDNTTRSYTYSYDGASRILQGSYTSTKANENYALNSVSYDANGNITILSRNGLKSNNTFGLIDNLNYTYNANSNKIQKVDDASNEIASFKDVAGNDYDYWQDGSLKKDNNKEITQIDYNYLKLPEQITLTGGRWIKYDYDADGVKLKKTLSTGQVTDYEEDEIYENAVLYQTSHDEGRIVGGVFEYNIVDHLGNLRVTFKDSLGIAKITQSNAYGIFGDDLPTLNYTSSLKTNKFHFNGKEVENDFGVGYTDFKWRFSDPILGRFHSVDRLAEKFSDISTYQFASNDPINKIELDGLEGVPAKQIQEGAEYFDYEALASASPNIDVKEAAKTIVESKTFNGLKNMTFGFLGMLGAAAYTLGTEGLGAGAGGAAAFSLAAGEFSIGGAQVLDAATGKDDGKTDVLHDSGSLPGLVANSAGSKNAPLIDATAQFATGALSGGNMNGAVDAGIEIMKGKNVVSNTLNLVDAHEDTKGFDKEVVKATVNLFSGNNAIRRFDSGTTPSDATRVNLTPKIIKTPKK
jgi:RHS repeat-associated protein